MVATYNRHVIAHKHFHKCLHEQFVVIHDRYFLSVKVLKIPHSTVPVPPATKDFADFETGFADFESRPIFFKILKVRLHILKVHARSSTTRNITSQA